MFIKQDDLNRSIFSLIKNNNGFFKSAGQYKVLTGFHSEYNRDYHSSQKTNMACKEDFKHSGNFFYLEGTVSFTPSDYRGVGVGGKAWAHACFFDSMGIYAQYKISFYGNLKTGTGPKSAKLIWERPTDVQGIDFGAKITEERVAREKLNNERLDKCVDLVSGRYEVTGIILSANSHENEYGGSNKMTIQLPDGSRIWGTIPSKLIWSEEHGFEDLTLLKGRSITLTATIEQKEKGFGFFKRPSKAKFN